MLLSENARRVLEARYLRRNAQGNLDRANGNHLDYRRYLFEYRTPVRLSYRRVGVLGDQTLVEWNLLLLALGEHMGYLTPEVLEHVANHGTLSNAPGVPDHVRDLFATALEITPQQHLLMQAAFQTGVDNAVSKTVNLPTEVSPDAVASIYRQAYHLGLKGITIYRYGSIAGQVLQPGIGEEPYEKEHASKCDPYQCKL